MADESKQTESTEQDTDTTEDESTEATKGRDGDKGGDEDKPGAALLKALQTEREARATAEAALKKREKADRDAETARAIKAGEFETVLKAKDTEIGELTTRVTELEGQIASAKLEAIRERVAAKYRLPAELAEVLRGANEDELTEHAKRLAKVVVVKAPNTEAGAGSGGNGKVPQEEVIRRMAASGKWAI